ncbi:MAG: hypothetical protein B7Y45_00335 [Sphingomonas sp. 28-66-16]|nr:MAG: hypothetical protein B7Y45_00335 [Sphingomonas sp. 28-66-16]
MRGLLIGLLLLAGGCATTPDQKQALAEAQSAEQAKLAGELAGLTPGRPQSCIPQGLVHYSTKTIGSTILYRVDRKLVYRNDTTGGCEDPNGMNALVSRNFGAQLCSGQIIASVDVRNNFTLGSCALRDFVPYAAK